MAYTKGRRASFSCDSSFYGCGNVGRRRSSIIDQIHDEDMEKFGTSKLQGLRVPNSPKSMKRRSSISGAALDLPLIGSCMKTSNVPIVSMSKTTKWAPSQRRFSTNTMPMAVTVPLKAPSLPVSGLNKSEDNTLAFNAGIRYEHHTHTDRSQDTTVNEIYLSDLYPTNQASKVSNAYISETLKKTDNNEIQSKTVTNGSDCGFSVDSMDTSVNISFTFSGADKEANEGADDIFYDDRSQKEIQMFIPDVFSDIKTVNKSAVNIPKPSYIPQIKGTTGFEINKENCKMLNEDNDVSSASRTRLKNERTANISTKTNKHAKLNYIKQGERETCLTSIELDGQPIVSRINVPSDELDTSYQTKKGYTSSDWQTQQSGISPVSEQDCIYRTYSKEALSEGRGSSLSSPDPITSYSSLNQSDTDSGFHSVKADHSDDIYNEVANDTNKETLQRDLKTKVPVIDVTNSSVCYTTTKATYIDAKPKPFTVTKTQHIKPSSIDEHKDTLRSYASLGNQRVNDEKSTQALIADNDSKVVVLEKGALGLGFCIEGGINSPLGDRPITVKRIFKGGAAAAGVLNPGDQIVTANGRELSTMTHYAVWSYLKSLPDGPMVLEIVPK